MKQIHFYKDECLDYNLDNKSVTYSHNSTMTLIKSGYHDIHTFAISALDFDYLLNNGYDIFLHENGLDFQIKEGHVVATDKEIRKAQNIEKIWIGGGFSRFFYNE